MIFRKDEIDVDTSYASRAEYVNLNIVLDRVNEAIKEDLSFDRDYSYGDWLTLDDAEKLIMKMYLLIKEIKE